MRVDLTLVCRVQNSRRTMVRSGTLVCLPYATSAKPFARDHPPSEIYGTFEHVKDILDCAYACLLRVARSTRAVALRRSHHVQAK
ncbi:hypothetical protein EON67_02405 [archaeon]|nr:MAG: hypothetical protein EON67_02405 [archaeon]